MQTTMVAHNTERRLLRPVPADSIMVSVSFGLSQGFGTLSDISEAGACIALGVHVQPGSDVLLRIQFVEERKFFTIDAEVVWSRIETRPREPKSFVHGIKFTMDTDEQRAQLRMMLNRPGFQKPTSPDTPPADLSGIKGKDTDPYDDLEALKDIVGCDKDSS